MITPRTCRNCAAPLEPTDRICPVCRRFTNAALPPAIASNTPPSPLAPASDQPSVLDYGNSTYRPTHPSPRPRREFGPAAWWIIFIMLIAIVRAIVFFTRRSGI